MTNTHTYIYTLQGLRYPREALQALIVSLEPFGQYNTQQLPGHLKIIDHIINLITIIICRRGGDPNPGRSEW